MGIFNERRKSSLPEAYTGVNRLPTSQDMPNSNAVAAASTIGKLFQGNTGSQINMTQASLSRSNSLSGNKLSLNYNSQLHNISAASSKEYKLPVKPRSNSGSLTSASSRPQRRHSVSSVPTAVNSHSFASPAQLNPAKQRQKQKVGNHANAAPAAPKMIQKTIPTAYGLKTIEVPEEEERQSISRTSSLMSVTKRYVPKHPTPKKTREESSAVRARKPQHQQLTSKSSSFVASGPYSHQTNSSSSLLLPPSHSKARKRVSFTEDSPAHSIISVPIAEEQNLTDESWFADSPVKHTIRGSSPLKSVLSEASAKLDALSFDNSGDQLTPPAAPPTPSAAALQQVSSTPSTPAKLSAPAALLTDSVAKNEPEKVGLEKDEIETLKEESELVEQASPVKPAEPAEPLKKISSPIIAQEPAKSSDSESNQQSSITNLTPETSTSIAASEPHKAPPAPIAESPEAPAFSTPKISKSKPKSEHRHPYTPPALKTAQVPVKSKKRNQIPSSIPSAHAFENTDSLSGYSKGLKVKNKPVSTEVKRATMRTANPVEVKRSQSAVSKRHSLGDHNIQRSQSSMAPRQRQRPMSTSGAGGFKSLRNNMPQNNTHVNTHINTHINTQNNAGTVMPVKPISNATLKPPLATKSSFEKVRPAENNLAFKRLSMRSNMGDPVSPTSQVSSGITSPVASIGIFKSRFEDSDDEETYEPHKFARHSMRKTDNSNLSKVFETKQASHDHSNGKLFGFSRHHKQETPSQINKSSIPDIITSVVPNQQSGANQDEPDVLKTPTSSINSDKLFQKHLKESKRHFLLSQFENSYSSYHQAKKAAKAQTSATPPVAGFASVNGDGAAEFKETPKKKKLGKLRKLFGV